MDFSKNLKIRLLIYAVISAIGFSYFIMPENAGISVPLFVVLQFVLLWFTAAKRKGLIVLVPIFIMSLNCFLSSDDTWRTPNLVISIILFSCMFMKLNIKNDSIQYLFNVVPALMTPFAYFSKPFKWIFEINSEKSPVVKRIFIALAVSVPCVVVLTYVLSHADMVFSLKINNLVQATSKLINFHTVYVILCGIIAGLYMFGTLYARYDDDISEEYDEQTPRGDLIIINIILSSILFVYTMFVIIQFKYLFAGSVLPQNLTYTEYARKGFFELLALTGVNIAIILTVIRLTKKYTGKAMLFTKTLCHYLCAVTVVLLVSSFYRMMLYIGDDGLTRLRFFVIGFLGFEAIGLFTTFVYIAKPKFNISAIYIALALFYYTVLNIIPSDNIIAKNQIDKYLSGERGEIDYIFTLSLDASPAMEYLYSNTDNEELIKNITCFFETNTFSDIPKRWQRYNLSFENAKNTAKKLGVYSE